MWTIIRTCVNIVIGEFLLQLPNGLLLLTIVAAVECYAPYNCSRRVVEVPKATEAPFLLLVWFCRSLWNFGAAH